MIILAWVKSAKMGFVEQELKENPVLRISTVTLDFHAEETQDLLLRQLAKFPRRLMNTAMRTTIARWIWFVIGSLQLRNCREENDAKKCTILLITLQ